jgi:hypothetical protein
VLLVPVTEVQVPKYFFHLQSESTVVPDTKGKEFQCVQDAHFHAQVIVRKAVPYLAADDGRWAVRIQSTSNDPEIIVLFPSHVSLNRTMAG